MVFSSTLFLFLFLPLVLIGYYNPIFKGRRFRNVFLLLASLAFYAWGEPVFVFVMLFSILLNWFFGLEIDKSANLWKRKTLMVSAVAFNLGLLFVFKYLTFVCENINLLAKTDYFTIKIALPIGISFYTFQIITYIVDIYKKRVSAQKSLINTGLYIAIFPPLIAGPIVRYESVADQIDNRKESSADFTAGMSRFIVGLGKKVLIANYMGFIADAIFSQSSIEGGGGGGVRARSPPMGWGQAATPLK
jgi:D-alanyl-lipoteichoic acid acyltransferase DltB (MBOAT superfamily)